MLFQSFFEKLQIVNALAATDNFTVTLGRNNIHPQSEFRANGIGNQQLKPRSNICSGSDEK